MSKLVQLGLVLGVLAGPALGAAPGRTFTCVTSNGAPGRCVAIEECPKLLYILNNAFYGQNIFTIKGARGACPSDSEKFCCGANETRNSICLQSRLGLSEDSIERHSVDSSFGVFITYRGSQNMGRCVGSLITPEYVLTAAHCVAEDYDIVLYVNAYEVTFDMANGYLTADGEERAVREIIVHEGYNSQLKNDDIALLRLNQSIARGPKSPKSVCIPTDTDPDQIVPVGHTLRCFGWGYNATGQPSQEKHWMTLERLSRDECQASFNRLQEKPTITDRNICTNTITGHDAFAGYSGGPMMYRKDGTWFLVGIVSYGVGKLNAEYPVVSTYVQPYNDWILSHIQRGD